MPYDNPTEQQKLDFARRGLDEHGYPIKREPAVPPKPPAGPNIRFGKPFSPEELKKQAAAKSRALRAHETKEDDNYEY